MKTTAPRAPSRKGDQASRLGSRRIISRFLRHRYDHALLLVGLSTLLATVVVGLSCIAASSFAAVEQSLRADLGGRLAAVQTSDPTLIGHLESIDAAAPVLDDLAEVMYGERAVPVLLRSTDDATLQLGVVHEGRRPQEPGEALVSRHAAEALGLSPGDRFSLSATDGEREATVVGIVRDPADHRARSVLLLTTEGEVSLATRWLFSNHDFADAEPIRTLLERRVGAYGSIDALLEAARSQPPPHLASLRFLPFGMGLLIMLALVGTALILSRTWAKDVETLTTSGMSARRAWTLIGGGVLLACSTGVLAGTVGVLLGLSTFRTEVSSLLGQDWSTIEVPYRSVLLTIGSVLVLGVLALVARRVPWARMTSAVTSRDRLVRPLPVWVGVLLAGLSMMLVATWMTPRAGAAAPFVLIGAAISALALPVALVPVLLTGLPPARRALTRRLTGALVPVVAAVCLIVVLGAAWAARTTYDANSGEAASSPLLPAGSFAISEVPDDLLPTVIEMYRQQGGKDVTSFAHVDERERQFRVTTPALAACAGREGTLDVPPECWPPPDRLLAAPVNVVMLSQEGSAAQADPGLVEAGQVGVILFDASDRQGRVQDTSRLTASAAPGLGGNLPGLVLAVDSPEVTGLGLRPSGSSLVVMHDYSTLLPQDQYEFRGAALRLVPGAQIADGTDPTFYDRQRSTATLVSLLSAALATVILLVGGTGQVAGERIARRAMRELGTHRRLVWSTAARWVALPAASLVLAGVLALASASFLGMARDASYGWLWLVPLAVPVVACGVLTVIFLHVPGRHSD